MYDVLVSVRRKLIFSACSPDKNPNVKDIHARFARLGTITEILRNPTKRTQYDVSTANDLSLDQPRADHDSCQQFFFKNGVPKWRGTGYYYSRFRPSIVHVLLFLVLLSSLIHYAILRVNYRRDKQRIDYFTRAALAKAGGSGALTNGSATPTTDTGSLPADGQDGVIACVIDQVDSAISPADSSAPVLSKRQAKLQAREAKRDKTKREPATSQAASGAATPVPVPAPSRRRKVRVPMIEGVEHSQSLELVVVDGQVFMASSLV
jgi:curved DNA-binding protein CbpA